MNTPSWECLSYIVSTILYCRLFLFLMAIYIMSSSVRAFLFMLLVPIFWGFTFPIMRLALENSTTHQFVFWRFLAATFMLLPTLVLIISHKKFNKKDFVFGVLLGLINGGVFVTQGLALEDSDSTRTALIMSMNVVIVPLLLPLFGMNKPRFSELVASAICLFGIYLIAAGDIAKNSISQADLWALSSALLIALAIIFTEKISRSSRNFSLLIFSQTLFTMCVPISISSTQTFVLPIETTFWLAIGYCAFFATIIPTFVQFKYQYVLGANKTAIILSLESVAAAIFAYAMGESITQAEIIGGVFIIVGSIYSDASRVFMHKITRYRHNRQHSDVTE